MFPPNSPKDEQDEGLPEWHEPFPEPNTIPAGWNFSPAAVVTVVFADMDKDESGEE
jgi:hypothetical protein